MASVLCEHFCHDRHHGGLTDHLRPMLHGLATESSESDISLPDVRVKVAAQLK
jgi:hypothetical protein